MGKVVLAEGAEIHLDLVTIPREHLCSPCSPFNFTLPIVSIATGEILVIARFTLPAGRTLMIVKAQIADDVGASVANLIIEAYDNTSASSIYSTDSNIIQEGNPLAESAAAHDITIRATNTSGSKVDCQGFMSVILAEAPP